MATTQEAIARLRMIFETQGAEAAVAEMKKLETAETSLGQSSLNLDRAFGNLERRFSETARAAFEHERSMKTLNAAVAQNPALAERAAAVQQIVTARYQATMQAARQAAQAQTAYGQVSQGLATQAQGLAASTGLLGSTFSTLGKAGTVAAVGIGGLYLAYQKLDVGVTRTAQYARDIQHFAEATGLTTSQVQGLNKEATKFGISTEDMHTGLLKFTAGFEEARNGGGAMLDMVRKIDAGLGDQALAATTEVEALDIVTEALRRASNEFERAALARAAFGRGGLKLLPMMQNLDVPAVTEKYATKGISEDLIKEITKLEQEVATKGTNIENRIYASFAEPWLKAKLTVIEYLESFLKVQEAANRQTMATHIQELIKLQKELQDGIEQLEKAATSDNFLDRLFSEANQANADAYKEKLKEVTAELDKLQGKMTDQARLEDAFKQTEKGTKGGGISEQAQASQMQALLGVLGNLASVEDQVALKALEINVNYRKLSEDGRRQVDELRESLLALARVQAEMSKVDPDAPKRQLQAIKALMAEYPGLVAQDAVRLALLESQLRIAQALPGLARMEAEELERISQLQGPGEGKTLDLATTIAAKERAVAQEQINSAAALHLQQLEQEYGVVTAITGVQRMQAQAQATYTQLVQQGVSAELAAKIAKQQTVNAQAQMNTQAQQQLLHLQNQAGVAGAVTGQQKMNAQQVATINGLLQQGVSLEDATAVAAQERANAESAVNAQIEQQIYKLDQSTELIRAQIKDLEAQAGSAHKILGINEMNVRAQQAFNDAIRQGASEEEALALKAATLRNLIAQQALQIAQMQPPQETVTPYRPTKTGLLPGAGSVVQEIEAFAQAGSALAKQVMTDLQGVRGAALLATPDLPELVQKMKQEAALAPQLQQYQQTQEQGKQQLKTLQDQYRLGAAGTPQEKAQIQAQITYEDLIKQGMASDLAHQIANQELANAMQDLAKSVDANTSALQDQLDPIYTEGRAALRIGYYGEGSGGTMRTVTGTGYANDNTGRAGGGDVYAGRAYMIGERGPELFVPGASGTIVPNAALRGADRSDQTGNVIIINNNFPPGAVMGDRRTQYQAANSYGRAISAMGS